MKDKICIRIKIINLCTEFKNVYESLTSYPIENALINISDFSNYTDELSEKILYLRGLEDDYKIFADKFVRKSGKLNVKEDTTLRVELKPLIHNLTAQIIDSISNMPVANAEMMLDENVEVSDSEGNISFDLRENLYNYNVVAPNYLEKIGNINLVKDTSINIILSPEYQENEQSLVFPNPVFENLYINSKYNIDKIELIDVKGNIVDEYIVSGKKYRINSIDLKAGMYILKLYSGGNVKTEQIQIVK